MRPSDKGLIWQSYFFIESLAEPVKIEGLWDDKRESKREQEQQKPTKTKTNAKYFEARTIY